MRTPPEIQCQECGYEGPGAAAQVGAYFLFMILALFASAVMFFWFPPVLFLFLGVAAVMALIMASYRGKWVCAECGSKNVTHRQEGS